MKNLHCGTAHLTDEELVEAFESCQLPAEHFHHADHVRLAWIYLRQSDEEAASERIAQSIRRFAAHHGKTEKYHSTMTHAWMRLVAAARRATPKLDRFQDFAARHPHLLEVRTLGKYYSAERLESEDARAGWLEPDLSPLP
jgi:hypothetical protein